MSVCENSGQWTVDKKNSEPNPMSVQFLTRGTYLEPPESSDPSVGKSWIRHRRVVNNSLKIKTF